MDWINIFEIFNIMEEINILENIIVMERSNITQSNQIEEVSITDEINDMGSIPRVRSICKERLTCLLKALSSLTPTRCRCVGVSEAVTNIMKINIMEEIIRCGCAWCPRRRQLHGSISISWMRSI